MTERPNVDQIPPRKFFTLFIALWMKWVMILFPVAIFVGILTQTFVPNALSAVPGWVDSVIVAVAPLALGLISACWVWWRGDTASVVTEPRIDGPTWLFSAGVNRWLYLIALPVSILAIVLLGRFGVVVPSRIIFLIGIGVLLLLLGLKFTQAVRRLR